MSTAGAGVAGSGECCSRGQMGQNAPFFEQTSLLVTTQSVVDSDPKSLSRGAKLVENVGILE